METSNASALSLGTIFHGRYQIIRAIKSGGMGAIYEVLDAPTNARRALKVMLPSVIESPALRARFALEARIPAEIESDHIVRISDAGVDEATGMPFLVMELLRGEELGALIKRGGPLPAADVVTYLYQAATALDKAHSASIIHRDIKPGNLFLTQRDDGSPCVKVLDFGIAKMLAKGAENTTQMVGTPLYMAPEQLGSTAASGPRIDIYALGHVA